MERIATLILVLSLLGCEQSSTPHEYDLPDEFPQPQAPEDNPMTKEKVALGRALFFEPALSINNTMSCASCHVPEKAFSDPNTVSIGATGESLNRNALALINVGYNGSFTWAHNGLKHIEQQLLIPLFNETPVEMGVTGNENLILARFNTEDYKYLVEQAFQVDTLNMEMVVKALASYVRSLVSFNSPFDNYAYRQQDDALTGSQIRGMELFFSEKTECFHCHGGFNFTQSSVHEFQSLNLQPFHNTGLYNEDNKGAYPADDRGLIDITLNSEDMGKFRAPTLRNIELTGPYMHDGSIQTLEQVIDFYAAGGRGAGVNNPLKSPFIKGFILQESEKQDLINFLKGLTDEKFIHNPQHQPPSPKPNVNID
ncbi:MbnH family di-heme enzyme [Glaciecola sp. 1036]|uniref:MbnH family di-heme enzyme n=1 Tax=Alteromonadaceae TaxID=72275 RepID=UPI003D03DD16